MKQSLGGSSTALYDRRMPWLGGLFMGKHWNNTGCSSNPIYYLMCIAFIICEHLILLPCRTEVGGAWEEHQEENKDAQPWGHKVSCTRVSAESWLLPVEGRGRNSLPVAGGYSPLQHQGGRHSKTLFYRILFALLFRPLHFLFLKPLSCFHWCKI